MTPRLVTCYDHYVTYSSDLTCPDCVREVEAAFNAEVDYDLSAIVTRAAAIRDEDDEA